MQSALHPEFNATRAHTDPWGVDKCKQLIEERLKTLAPAQNVKPVRLSEAIRYNLLSPGKRVRGLLAVLCADCFGGNREGAVDIACSIEMIHGASLALDDLPAMDNAKLRRGSDCSYLVFGEDTTILCAVTMLNNAYQCVSNSALMSDGQKVASVKLLSDAVGLMGLTGGQQLDLHREPGTSPIEDVELVHSRKTGALFAAAAAAGSIVSGKDEAAQKVMYEVGMLLGVAFQIYDDLIDVFGCSHAEGKVLGADLEKQTMVSVIGAKRAEDRADAHIERALGLLAGLGGNQSELLAYLQQLRDHFKKVINPPDSPD
jgi:geranylgeranyl diphosphate synthase type II